MRDLRDQIDGIDDQIIRLIGKRMGLVKEIGQMKQSADSEIRDEGREEAIRSRLKELAAKEGLDDEFVDRLYTHIFTESKRIQEASE